MDEKKRRLEDDEIDVGELIRVLFSKIVIIVFCTLLFATAACLYTVYGITPLYKSNTKMYVLNQANSSYITSSDMQASTYLARDYAKIIQSRTVAEAVIKELDLDMSVESLERKISVSTEDETRVVTIYVSDADPMTAKMLADEVREQAAERIVSVMNIEAVNVVDVANLPLGPYNINLKKNIAIGGAAGFLLACGIIILLWIMNDTIQTSEDIEKYLELSTLAVIPLNEKEAKRKRRKRLFKKKKHGKKKRG